MTGVFANRWWIVFACACGLLVGAGSILIFSFGVFLKPITAELGITRGELSVGLGISAWFVALACPTIGWLIDRFGSRRVMIPGILLFALAVASFGLMQAKPLFMIYVIFCVAGFISRYFGLKAYGKIYGLMFLIFNIGTSLGPALSGRAFDVFHSYTQVFAVYEVALAITCLLLIRLGAYAYPVQRHAAPPVTKAA